MLKRLIIIYLFFPLILINGKNLYAQHIEDSLTIKGKFFNKLLKKRIKEKIAFVEMPVPVGFTDIDNKINDLQLQGKIPESYSLTNRPFYTDTKLTYDSLLKLIDTSIHYSGRLINHKLLKIRLLPISILQKYNSAYPYGGNDGALSLSKGYQYSATSGLGIKLGPLNIILKPEIIHISNDKYETSSSWGYVAPPVQKVLLGNSSIRLDLWKLTIGVSNENRWFGPGKVNSLLMSNNAPGFLHLSLGTNRPIKTWLGLIEFNIISGNITQNKIQGFENLNLFPRVINQSDRYLNEILVSFQPSILKNVTLGFIRSFQNYSNGAISKSFITNYLPVFNGIFKNSYNDDNLSRDQLLSFYTRWLMPKNNAEFYFEFGYNDSKLNSRDLLLDMSHSAAYIFGFKKVQPLNNNFYLSLGFEAIKLAQSPSYIHRNAGNWYEHSTVTEGYTNENQIIGAGVGFGNTAQQLKIDYNKNIFSMGLIAFHNLVNPLDIVTDINTIGLRTYNWSQIGYGIYSTIKLDKFIFSTNLLNINSKNYAWIPNRNKSNLLFQLNTTYLW